MKVFVLRMSHLTYSDKLLLYPGVSSRKSLWGEGGYVNFGPLILDNIRTIVKALQKQNS